MPRAGPSNRFRPRRDRRGWCHRRGAAPARPWPHSPPASRPAASWSSPRYLACASFAHEADIEGGCAFGPLSGQRAVVLAEVGECAFEDDGSRLSGGGVEPYLPAGWIKRGRIERDGTGTGVDGAGDRPAVPFHQQYDGVVPAIGTDPLATPGSVEWIAFLRRNPIAESQKQPRDQQTHRLNPVIVMQGKLARFAQ